ncbi:hypothetical protein [Methyloversatilis thermotolerans]|uniref:hypothetical protein n=1 Tax=Methyloversatilis thermotolerans TaxID=1346290 RepID=UPI000370EA60|nr:hypothetical protein [Methyloversatilis thermotolerans]
MEKRSLPDGALDVLLKEHAYTRDEIKERLKIAFSHVAYAGAIAAFAFPAADKIKDWVNPWLSLPFAFVAFAALAWVAFLNMRWVQHLGVYSAAIERRVNEHFGEFTMGWEHYAECARMPHWWKVPPRPEVPLAPIEEIVRDGLAHAAQEAHARRARKAAA